MNLNKAREFFSSYYEGTLEPSLHTQFERALREDAQIQAEYKAFVRAVEAIASMQQQEVEIPFDLHDRISARIDRHVWEQKQNQKTSWFGAWWRSLAVGAVACVAIIGTVITISQGSQSSGQKVATSGVIATVNSAGPILVSGEKGLTIRASRADATSVRLTNLDSGEVLGDFSVPEDGLNRALSNQGNEPQLIRVDRGNQSVVVALPGQQAPSVATGQGESHSLAKALASFYRIPVEIRGSARGHEFVWNFTGSKPDDATALAIPGAKVTKASGYLTLQISSR
jgi:hypothetical protein